MHCQLCGLYFTNCNCFKKKKYKLQHSITTALIEFQIILKILSGQKLFLKANETLSRKPKIYIHKNGTGITLTATFKPMRNHRTVNELHLIDSKGQKLYWRKVLPRIDNNERDPIKLEWSFGFGQDEMSGYVNHKNKSWTIS